MTNADKFKQVFGLYATELWSMSEQDFLEWLNSGAFSCSEIPNSSDLISRQAAIDAISCDITVTGRQNAEVGRRGEDQLSALGGGRSIQMTNEEAAEIIEGIEEVQGNLPEDGLLVEEALTTAVAVLRGQKPRKKQNMTRAPKRNKKK